MRSRHPQGRSAAWYRRLLFVYPASFRSRNEERMVETFAELCAATRARDGRRGLALLWLHTFVDLARNGIAARRSGPLDSRAPRKGIIMEDLVADIRYALRTLRRSPAFTAIAVATMALGIGVNAAMFSFFDAVVLRPLPFPAPERLVEVWETYQADSTELRNVSYPAVLDWRERVAGFQDIAALTGSDVALTEVGEAQRVSAQLVDPQYFDILGVGAARGRDLEEADNVAYAQAPVAVIGHALWQGTFGGDEAILGRTIWLNGVATTVVGIMPEGFAGPYGQASMWLPLVPGLRVAQVPESAVTSRGNRGLRAVARLAPGATAVSVQEELDAVTMQFRNEYPDRYVDRASLTLSLEDEVLGDTREPVLMLMIAVGLVLLVACANVANLMLARAAGRREEIAMRFALGAGRARMVRQLLTESMLLALIGGATGLLAAVWSLDALVAQSPFPVPPYVTVGVDGAVVAYTVTIALLTGVLFGLLPALTASRTGLAGVVGKRGSGSRRRRIVGLDGRGLLVAGEIALSLTLLVGAALLLQSFARVRTIEPGFAPQGLLTGAIELPGSRYQPEQIAGFAEELLTRLRETPGVAAAALASDTPLVSGYSAMVIANEEGMAAEPEVTIRVYRHSITPGYIEAMGARLTAGRGFGAGDTATAPGVVLVSEELARRAWPGEQAVGQRVTYNGEDWLTVVGVVADIRHRQLVVDTFENPDDPDIYYPLAQMPRRGMSLMVRARGRAEELAEPVRRAVQELDPDLPLFDVAAMTEVVADEVQINRASARLLTGFGTLALLLAVIGIYGVMAAAVSARSREIGVRVALGAPRTHVIGIVLARSVGMAAVGIVAGVAGALASARLLDSLLYGVSATDPTTIAVVAALLLAATVVASYVPVRRALAVDPAKVLQAD